MQTEDFNLPDVESCEKDVVKEDCNNYAIDSAINFEASSSEDTYRTSTKTIPSTSRKSPHTQTAAVFSDANKERSLSVTTQQMLGKFQDGEIKRFLTGLGNLAKSCELHGIENSGIPKQNSCCKGKEKASLNCIAASNSISTRDSYPTRTVDYGNVDTLVISNQTGNEIGKSCAV